MTKLEPKRLTERAIVVGAIVFAVLAPAIVGTGTWIDPILTPTLIFGLAAASLIFGGVLDLYPGLRIYLAHGGGSCAFLAGRWDRGWQVRPEAREHLPAAPSSYLRRLAFDSLTHGDAQLRFLVEQVGAGQVMLGTDYPYDMGEPDPVARIVAQGLGDADRDRVLGGNAAAMFGF